MLSPQDATVELIRLSRLVGQVEAVYQPLGETSASALYADGVLLTRAGDAAMTGITAADLVACDQASLLQLLQGRYMTPSELAEKLAGTRLGGAERTPAEDAPFHAFLLTLPEVQFVAQARPIALCRVLCSPHARRFSDIRILPDDVRLAGPASVFVPATESGLPLFKSVRSETEFFIKRHERIPKVYLFENLGIITLGRTVDDTFAALLSMQKAAEIFLGSAILGGPNVLDRDQINRVAGPPGEAERMMALSFLSNRAPYR